MSAADRRAPRARYWVASTRDGGRWVADVGDLVSRLTRVRRVRYTPGDVGQQPDHCTAERGSREVSPGVALPGESVDEMR